MHHENDLFYQDFSISSPTFRGRDECPDEEEEDEDAEDDAEPLDEVEVRDLDGLGRPHAEYHRYSKKNTC